MRKMSAQSLVVEELLLNQELLDEKSMIEARCGDSINLTAHRHTFFSSKPRSTTWMDPKDLPDESLLGYAVIVELALPNKVFNYMLEAIVRLPVKLSGDAFTPVTNYYMHNAKTFRTIIGTTTQNRKFTITGSFFSQQNDLTSVCAHACLRMAINSSPLLNTPKLTNKQINSILGIDFSSPNKQVGHYTTDPAGSKTGLDNSEMIKVVNSLGFNVHYADFIQKPDVQYDHFLYPFVESHCPTILFLQGLDLINQRQNNHVVAVFGHTLNSDRWDPEAHIGYGSYPVRFYIPTAAYCDHFLIGDDNYGMYLTLPTESMKNSIVPPAKNPCLHAVMVVAIVPQQVKSAGYVAEQRAINVLSWLLGQPESNVWLDRMRKQTPVFRTLLQTKDEYRGYIQANVKQLSDKQQQCLANLPGYLWVSEISLPNIYAGNKHKLGDVVHDATVTPQQLIQGDALVWAWAPGIVQIGPQPNKETWETKTHIPLICGTSLPFREW
jgi:hypothetical protein